MKSFLVYPISVVCQGIVLMPQSVYGIMLLPHNVTSIATTTTNTNTSQPSSSSSSLIPSMSSNRSSGLASHQVASSYFPSSASAPTTATTTPSSSSLWRNGVRSSYDYDHDTDTTDVDNNDFTETESLISSIDGMSSSNNTKANDSKRPNSSIDSNQSFLHYIMTKTACKDVDASRA
jgi:hypothetical protein